MSARYWERLTALLQQTKEVSLTLRPRPSEDADPDKGVLGRVAHATQGLPPAEAAAIAVTNPEWAAEWKAERVGTILYYGVSEAIAPPEVLAWVAEKVRPETLHIPIFEADVSALGIEFADRLVKVRGRMRGIRQRCELCVRIIAATEGRGRKVNAPALEKLKLQFEKAEAAERKKEERRRAAEEKAAAAEQARLLREKKREEKEEKKSAKKSSAQKKERQMSATKSFMMRFVKKVQAPQVVRNLSDRMDNSVSPVKSGNPGDDAALVPGESRMVGMAAFEDKSVLSVSLWLVLQITFDYAACSLEVLQGREDFRVDVNSIKEHLEQCGKRRKEAERGIGRVLGQYRHERVINREDRTPRFAARRSDLRGQGKSGPIQLLQFGENHRPAFVGTTSRRSTFVSGRRPLAKDKEINYEYDSEDEWEEEAEDGESLSDVEVEKEKAREDAELRILYGSDDESDDEDFLDDENAEVDDEGDEEDCDVEASEITPKAQCISTQNAKTSSSPEGKDVVMVDKANMGDKCAVVDVDAWQAPEVIDVDTFQPSKKRPLPASKPGTLSKKKRRRKQNVLNRAHVHIVGIDYGDSGKPSMLDKFVVRAHVGGPLFKVYDPAEEEARAKQAAAAAAAAKPVPVVRQSNSRAVLDAAAKFDLAMLICGQSAGKDRLVHQFLLLRKSRNQDVPTMSEVHRTIFELAVREKRGIDSRAHYYLRDPALETAVRAQLAKVGRPQINFAPISAPIIAASSTGAVNVPGPVPGSGSNLTRTTPVATRPVGMPSSAVIAASNAGSANMPGPLGSGSNPTRLIPTATRPVVMPSSAVIAASNTGVSNMAGPALSSGRNPTKIIPTATRPVIMPSSAIIAASSTRAANVPNGFGSNPTRIIPMTTRPVVTPSSGVANAAEDVRASGNNLARQVPASAPAVAMPQSGVANAGAAVPGSGNGTTVLGLSH